MNVEIGRRADQVKGNTMLYVEDEPFAGMEWTETLAPFNVADCEIASWTATDEDGCVYMLQQLELNSPDVSYLDLSVYVYPEWHTLWHDKYFATHGDLEGVENYLQDGEWPESGDLTDLQNYDQRQADKDEIRASLYNWLEKTGVEHPGWKAPV